MITGIVNDLEAQIQLEIKGRRRHSQNIQAVVDTGFNGWLALPPSLIVELDLRWKSDGRAILADGRESRFDLYQATIVWDRRVRRILVGEFDGDPLVGMALLKGCELNMQVRARGKVTIKPLRRRRSD